MLTQLYISYVHCQIDEMQLQIYSFIFSTHENRRKQGFKVQFIRLINQ